MAFCVKRTFKKSFQDPRSIAGLYAWYDATQGLFNATAGGSAVTANNALVARWEDMSGNARHLTQSNSSLQPALLTASRNSKNVLSFNGDFLVSANNWGLGTNKVFVFYVAKWNSWNTASVNALFDWSGGNTVAGQFSAWNFQNAFSFRYHTNGFWETNSQISMNAFGTSWHLLSSMFPRNPSASFNYETYINKNLAATIVANDNNIDFASNRYFGIGDTINDNGTPIGSFPGNFHIAELAIYITSNTLTTKNRQDMENYLSNKWAI